MYKCWESESIGKTTFHSAVESQHQNEEKIVSYHWKHEQIKQKLCHPEKQSKEYDE